MLLIYFISSFLCFKYNNFFRGNVCFSIADNMTDHFKGWKEKKLHAEDDDDDVEMNMNWTHNSNFLLGTW